MRLTEQQQRAIAHRSTRNLLLVACAGSGKTEVVAQRIVGLLRDGEPPAAMVAFTFTEKAAAELKERILTRSREALGEVIGLAEMFVGTIHAFCLDLLKSEVPQYLKYDVLNEVQQILFVDRNSSKSGLTTSSDLKGQPLRRWIDTGNYVQALSLLREGHLVPDRLTDCSVVEGLKAYQGLCHSKGYFDYSSILDVAANALHEDGGVRTRLIERLRHVIVDEYQDLNPVQERIVRSLHDLGARLCVVGDDDQTIYQWRGSDVNNILDFERRYPEVTRIDLQENFRSSRGIVDTARNFISANSERLVKAMEPTEAQEFETGDIVALSFDSPEEEARHIAETARQLHGLAIRETSGERGISWSDMAVLLRSVKNCGEPIMRALEVAEVPYVIVGMNQLFETVEAQAARLLFFFVAKWENVDAGMVLDAWCESGTGVSRKTLERAIKEVIEARKLIHQGDGKMRPFYNIQRLFLTFLEDIGLREELVPAGRGEVLFYNLGKFSQLISDFESIHFHSDPLSKYQTFAKFLHYQADGAYPEGWQGNTYASPDAVRIMTVHQAKGLQWPVVFVPALTRNRFPSKAQGGRNVWHLLPHDGVVGQARFRGTIEDERRLFYVAVTRSQKLLHLTWAPTPGKKLYQVASEFWNDVLGSKFVKRRPVDYSARKRLPPHARSNVADVVLTFSSLRYFFDCPYQFKLHILYGFNPPLAEALGYGRSLHDALAEVHSRAIRGDYATVDDVPKLVEVHLRTPYAYAQLKEKLEEAARRVLTAYILDNTKHFDKIEFSEKNIEISLGDGISVVGRIDLVRRLDTQETKIIDLKSKARAQAEEVTETQLHVYALGYQQLTGRDADYVETYHLEERKAWPRAVDDDFIEDVKVKVRHAATSLRESHLPPKPSPKTCGQCAYHRLCSSAAPEC